MFTNNFYSNNNYMSSEEFYRFYIRRLFDPTGVNGLIFDADDINVLEGKFYIIGKFLNLIDSDYNNLLLVHHIDGYYQVMTRKAVIESANNVTNRQYVFDKSDGNLKLEYEKMKKIGKTIGIHPELNDPQIFKRAAYETGFTPGKSLFRKNNAKGFFISNFDWNYEVD